MTKRTGPQSRISIWTRQSKIGKMKRRKTSRKRRKMRRNLNWRNKLMFLWNRRNNLLSSNLIQSSKKLSQLQNFCKKNPHPKKRKYNWNPKSQMRLTSILTKRNLPIWSQLTQKMRRRRKKRKNQWTKLLNNLRVVR